MMDGTYSADVTCDNCGKESTVEIPKGVPIRDGVCPECGCTDLRRKGEQPLPFVMAPCQSPYVMPPYQPPYAMPDVPLPSGVKWGAGNTGSN